MEDQILETLDDELGADYNRDFRKYIGAYMLPLTLDEFMSLEMSFYESYKRRKSRPGGGASASTGLKPAIHPA